MEGTIQNKVFYSAKSIDVGDVWVIEGSNPACNISHSIYVAKRSKKKIILNRLSINSNILKKI